MEQTTIAAIATPKGSGGVGIIRLSGPQSVSIVEKIFSSYQHKRVADLPGFTGTLGQIREESGEVVDEVIVFRYRAPHSYTGEEVVEISGHGGVWVNSRVLRLCYGQGAVPAEAGEFTKRAFLNGKMDLVQAEGVMDIIAAQGNAALKAANQLYEGKLSREISALTNRITVQAGHLAAWADYPEEDLEAVEESALQSELISFQQEMVRLLSTYDYGRIAKEGITTAIVGKPNVGKSTLMNLLIGYDRSIVSDIPGTTRDVVTESARIGDLVLNLADTAGIRESDDPIEQIGVGLARDKIAESQLVLLLLDNSRGLDAEDRELLGLLQEKPSIVLVNKSDLPPQLELDEVARYSDSVLAISAQESDGLDELEERIKGLLHLDGKQEDQAVLANERQRLHLLRAKEAVDGALEAMALGITLDAITVCLEEVLDQLYGLTGQRASDKIVEQVFSTFCVGK